MQKPQKNCLFLCYIKDYSYLCTAFEKCTNMVAVVQLVRASDCGSECRGFESHLPPAQERGKSNGISSFLFISPEAVQKQTTAFIPKMQPGEI